MTQLEITINDGYPEQADPSIPAIAEKVDQPIVC